MRREHKIYHVEIDDTDASLKEDLYYWFKYELLESLAAELLRKRLNELIANEINRKKYIIYNNVNHLREFLILRKQALQTPKKFTRYEIATM